MDGRRFAEEFLRRRKQAEKGIVEPANTATVSSVSTTGDMSAGWSQVAKKGPPKEETPAGFKVVPNKKKGKKWTQRGSIVSICMNTRHWFT